VVTDDYAAVADDELDAIVVATSCRRTALGKSLESGKHTPSRTSPQAADAGTSSAAGGVKHGQAPARYIRRRQDEGSSTPARAGKVFYAYANRLNWAVRTDENALWASAARHLVLNYLTGESGGVSARGVPTCRTTSGRRVRLHQVQGGVVGTVSWLDRTGRKITVVGEKNIRVRRRGSEQDHRPTRAPPPRTKFETSASS
jgi:hypothetical protein